MNATTSWGGAKKVYTDYIDYYRAISNDKSLSVNYDIKDLIHIAVGVGMNSGIERTPLTKRTEVINCYSIDNSGVIETLLALKYPDKEGKELLEVFQEYADIGIQIMYDNYQTVDDFDISAYLVESE